MKLYIKCNHIILDTKKRISRYIARCISRYIARYIARCIRTQCLNFVLVHHAVIVGI